MKLNINSDEAQKYLSDINDHRAFWINNGPVVKNLDELKQAIRTIDMKTFGHHFNKEKNDFAKWIEDVVGDHSLANSLSRAKSQKSAEKKIDFRIKQLRSVLSS